MKIENRTLALICLSAALVSTQSLLADGHDCCKPGSEKSTARKTNQRAPETRINHLMGSDVRSQDGEVVGKIEDFLINRRNGTIDYIIVGEEGGDGAIVKRVPIPWQAARIRDGREMVLNVDKSKFQSAPTSRQEDFSDLSNNQDVVVEVFRFYELEPPSAMGAPGTESGVESGGGTGR